MAEPTTVERPLSPHLQIFRPMVNMVMSILHRITVAALYFGMGLLVWWLVAAAVSEEQFALAQGVFGSWFGLIVLLGFSWAPTHHALGGIRHPMWHMGYGLSTRGDRQAGPGATWLDRSLLAGGARRALD